MTKLYGMLAYACGSIALATLVLGIMVGGGRQAWAVEEATASAFFATTCDSTCSGSYPLCGTGACSTVGDCAATSCKIILAGSSYKACECNNNT